MFAEFYSFEVFCQMTYRLSLFIIILLEISKLSFLVIGCDFLVAVFTTGCCGTYNWACSSDC